ncbi:MAG: DCC1-like thiol-disulfide oxidoreductase family protein [Pseudomonadota bacterium]
MDHDIIVFDGDCIFCSGFARFMAKHDHDDRFRFVNAWSPRGQALYEAHGLDGVAMETNIVIVDGVAHTKMAAFAAAMGTLNRPWRWLAALRHLPRRPANWLYDRIARNRYAFGKRSCPLPSAALRGRLVD